MVANPYTREVSVKLTELVPDRAVLPLCHGWTNAGPQCRNKAKYVLDSVPVCAVHIRPGTLFMPEKWLKE